MDDQRRTTEIPPELIGQIVQGDVVLFVGAGLSMDAGLPGWRKLLTPLADRIGLSPDRRGDLLQVAQYCVNRLGRQVVIAHIRDETDTVGRQPTANHRRLIALGITSWVTTNYDDLLEQALQQAGVRCDVVVREKELSLLRGDVDGMIKLHGDRDDPQSIVISRDDYNVHFQRNPLLRDHFKSLLATKSFLFVGYSLGDPDLELVRAEVSERLGDFQRPAYAVLFDADPLDVEDLGRHHIHVLNLATGGQPIHGRLLGEFLDTLEVEVRTAGGGRRPGQQGIPEPPPPPEIFFGRGDFLDELAAELPRISAPGVARPGRRGQDRAGAEAGPSSRGSRRISRWPRLACAWGRSQTCSAAWRGSLRRSARRQTTWKARMTGSRTCGTSWPTRLACWSWTTCGSENTPSRSWPRAGGTMRVLLTTREARVADDLHAENHVVRPLNLSSAVQTLAVGGTDARRAWRPTSRAPRHWLKRWAACPWPCTSPAAGWRASPGPKDNAGQ